MGVWSLSSFLLYTFSRPFESHASSPSQLTYLLLWGSWWAIDPTAGGLFGRRGAFAEEVAGRQSGVPNVQPQIDVRRQAKTVPSSTRGTRYTPPVSIASHQKKYPWATQTPPHTAHQKHAWYSANGRSSRWWCTACAVENHDSNSNDTRLVTSIYALTSLRDTLWYIRIAWPCSPEDTQSARLYSTTSFRNNLKNVRWGKRKLPSISSSNRCRCYCCTLPGTSIPGARSVPQNNEPFQLIMLMKWYRVVDNG